MSIDHVQLRSEKVRSIVGGIPTIYLKCGVCIITILVILVVSMIHLIKITLYQEYQLYMINDKTGYIIEQDILPVNKGNRYTATDGYCILTEISDNNTYYFDYTSKDMTATHDSTISVLLPIRKVTMSDIIKSGIFFGH